MSALIFVRHGETDLAGCFCGQIDPPLNEAGKRQAAALAGAVAALGMVRICASPLLRARQTAELIGRQTGLAIEWHPGLREIGFGLWEGLHWSQIEARWPREAGLWVEEFPHRDAPQGESYSGFCSRVDTCIRAIAATTERTTAIVTHRGVIVRALTRFFSYSDRQAREATAAYCARVVIEIGAGENLL